MLRGGDASDRCQKDTSARATRQKLMSNKQLESRLTNMQRRLYESQVHGSSESLLQLMYQQIIVSLE